MITSTTIDGPPRRALRAEGPPRSVLSLSFLMVATSAIVLREPAPCDVLFPLLVGAILCFGRIPLAGYGLLTTTGTALLVVANLVSSAFAWLPPSATGRYLAITLYLLATLVVFAGLVAEHGSRIVVPLLRAYLLAAALASVIGILARFRLIPSPEIFYLDPSGLRIKSTFKDPNVFAPFVAAAMIVALDDLLTARRGLLRTLAYQTLFVLAILFAFSRGAFLNLLVALSVYAFLRVFWLLDAGARRRLLGMVLASAVVVVPVALWALTASGLDEYLSSRLALQRYDSQRFGAQREALEVAARHGLGIGPGNWTRPRFATDTHNVYLRVLAENGALGLVGFLLLVLGSLVRGGAGLRAPGARAGWCAVSLAVIAGTLVESAVIDTLHWRHFFLFLALPVGLAMRSEE